MNGLQNIGNTCYLNSALQMLLNIEDFCSLVIKHSNISNKMKIISDFINNYKN